MKRILLAAAAALAFGTALPAAAADNLSFETGDTSSWSATPAYVSVVPFTDNAIGPDFPDFGGMRYLPTDGSDFARLSAGPGGAYTLLSQIFTLSGAGSISFDAAFLTFDVTSDGEGHNDNGFVHVFGQGQDYVLFQSDVDTVGDQGSVDWANFSQSLAAGTYTIEAAVRNVGVDLSGDFDPTTTSQVLLDNVVITDAGPVAGGVPEPAAWALMIVGFAGLGGALRARRSAVLQGA